MNYIVPKYLLILLSRRVKRSSQSRKLDRKDNRFIETLHLLSGERKHTKKSPSHSWVTHFINLKPLQALYKFKCWEQECQKGKMALEDQLHRHKVQPKQEKMGWWRDLVLERLKKIWTARRHSLPFQKRRDDVNPNLTLRDWGRVWYKKEWHGGAPNYPTQYAAAYRWPPGDYLGQGRSSVTPHTTWRLGGKLPYRAGLHYCGRGLSVIVFPSLSAIRLCYWTVVTLDFVTGGL